MSTNSELIVSCTIVKPVSVVCSTGLGGLGMGQLYCVVKRMTVSIVMVSLGQTNSDYIIIEGGLLYYM